MTNKRPFLTKLFLHYLLVINVTILEREKNIQKKNEQAIARVSTL